MLAVDKNILVKWLAPHQNTNFTVAWVHQKVNAWEETLAGREDQDLFMFQMNTYWLSGRLNPVVFVIYSPSGGGQGGGNWMAQPSLTYTISPNWYAKVAVQAFLGEKHKDGVFASLIPTSEVTFKVGYQW